MSVRSFMPKPGAVLVVGMLLVGRTAATSMGTGPHYYEEWDGAHGVRHKA